MTATNIEPPLLGPRNTLDYFNQLSRDLPRSLTPLEAWNLMFATPLPGLSLAFAVRDRLSSLFGVRRVGGFSHQPRHRVSPGDHLDFFLVEQVDDTHLVLTERDRHLDVMTTLTCVDRRILVTSSVITHNLFGRVYMIPVALAHPIIVKATLRRLQVALAAE